MGIKFNIKEKFTAIDFFGQGVTFNTDGKSQIQSCPGALLSIVILVITMIYGYQRFYILRMYGDTTFQEVVESQQGLEWYNQTETDFAFAIRFVQQESIVSFFSLEQKKATEKQISCYVIQQKQKRIWNFCYSAPLIYRTLTKYYPFKVIFEINFLSFVIK